MDVQSRFGRLIDSLDGDLDLFTEIAGPVATHYRSAAGQIDQALAAGNLLELRRIAHKLKATWSLYASSRGDLPDRIESAIEGGNGSLTGELARELSQALCEVCGELEHWVRLSDDRAGKS